MARIPLTKSEARSIFDELAQIDAKTSGSDFLYEVGRLDADPVSGLIAEQNDEYVLLRDVGEAELTDRTVFWEEIEWVTVRGYT